MGSSIRVDTLGNIICVSDIEAELNGAGFIDVVLPEGITFAQLSSQFKYIDGFVLRSAAITHFHVYKNGDWVLDIEKVLLDEIATLEGSITPRRLREALLGDSSWLLAAETTISQKREALRVHRNSNI